MVLFIASCPGWAYFWLYVVRIRAVNAAVNVPVLGCHNRDFGLGIRPRRCALDRDVVVST